MTVIETERLVLRRMAPEDAPFILALLNEPSFLRFIGDKGVRTLEDARQYIVTGPLASYEQHGFGLYLVELRFGGTPIGICGLLKRDTLLDADIGFAFAPEFWRKGYAIESATAVLQYGRDALGLKRLVAITSPDNHDSMKILTRLGLRFEQMIRLAEGREEVRLFGRDLE